MLLFFKSYVNKTGEDGNLSIGGLKIKNYKTKNIQKEISKQVTKKLYNIR